MFAVGESEKNVYNILHARMTEKARDQNLKNGYIFGFFIYSTYSKHIVKNLLVITKYKSRVLIQIPGSETLLQPSITEKNQFHSFQTHKTFSFSLVLSTIFQSFVDFIRC